MNPEQQKREEEIFQAALDISGLAERQACLAGTCGGDPELRRGVEELLQADNNNCVSFANRCGIQNSGGGVPVVEPGKWNYSTESGVYGTPGQRPCSQGSASSSGN
jgi:hypothetical protein